MPGVIAVSATGNKGRKSFYSNYGMDVINVAAPGGDSRQVTAQAANGRVLSTYPVGLKDACIRPVVDPAGGPRAFYCYLQGTSMASPHVTGLVALMISQFGEMSAGEIRQRLEATADPIACPTAADLALYAFFPSQNNGAPQTCTGSPSHNSWYGFGQINALKAIRGEGDDNQN
jgi:subtilisin family serine protease